MAARSADLATTLPDEGVKKVVERLKETKGTDVEAAFAWMVSKEPKPQPTKASRPARISSSATESYFQQPVQSSPLRCCGRSSAARRLRPTNIIGDLLRRSNERAGASLLLRIVYAHLKACEARRAREAKSTATME